MGPDYTIETVGSLNVERFFEAMGVALTGFFQKDYPGVEITCRGIRKKEEIQNEKIGA